MLKNVNNKRLTLPCKCILGEGCSNQGGSKFGWAIEGGANTLSLNPLEHNG